MTLRQFGPVVAAQEHHTGPYEQDREPRQRGCDRQGTELPRRPAARRPPQGATPPERGGEPGEDSGPGDGHPPHECAAHNQCDGAEEEGQCAAGEGLRPVVHPRAQHGGPQGDEGARDGQPDPAERKNSGVRQQQPGLECVVRAARQQHSEGRSNRHTERRRDVVANRHAETRGHRGPQPAPQLQAMPEDGDRHPGSPGQGNQPAVHQHSGHDDANPGEEEDRAPVLDAAAVDIRTGLEQGLAEMGAPHHRRVGQRTEKNQMHHQPARTLHERMDEGHHSDRDQPEQRRKIAPRPKSLPPCRFRLADTGGRFDELVLIRLDGHAVTS